jgi:hypothetical protein
MAVELKTGMPFPPEPEEKMEGVVAYVESDF